MGTGLLRDGAYVRVSYEGGVAIPISTALYRQRGYQPPLEHLPAKEACEAAQSERANAG